MHFTHWPSLKSTTGEHFDVSWGDMISFVKSPIEGVAEKSSLPGWSPAQFSGDRRLKSCVKAVSCLVLDLDEGDLSGEAVAEVFEQISIGIAHTTFSTAPGARKWRVVLYLSRDVTPAQFDMLWQRVNLWSKKAGIVVDGATKDPSRLWYGPAVPGNGLYEWRSW